MDLTPDGMHKLERPDTKEALEVFGDLYGFTRTQLIATYFELGIESAVVSGHSDIEALVERTGAHRPSLSRLLRALLSIEVLAGDERGFRLGRVGSLLHRHGLGPFATYLARETYQAWGSLEASIRSGESAFVEAHSQDYFAWLACEPDRAERFDRAMAVTVASRVGPLLRHPWTPGSSVVDVGGGRGEMLALLLREQETLHGLLFDRPKVAAEAARYLGGQHLGGRVSTLGGDFFSKVPQGADTYLLAQVLHDWDDEDALRILAVCARAAGVKGRILLVEAVVDEPPAPGDATWVLDLNMLVMLGGRERNLNEWADLVSGAGLRVVRITRGTRASVIELRSIDAATEDSVRGPQGGRRKQQE